MPALMPVALVSKLNIHWPLARRNWSPVVAASVGEASMAVPAVVWSEYLIACSRWMPERTGEPLHAQVNLTGMVLLNLKICSGLA